MRQNLSKGMIVAGAATSILSLWGIPAFADSQTGATTEESLGALFGHSVSDITADAPAKAEGLKPAAGRAGARHTADGYGDDSASGQAAGQTGASGSGRVVEHGDASGSGQVTGHGQANGSGRVAGHGDASGPERLVEHGGDSALGRFTDADRIVERITGHDDGGFGRFVRPGHHRYDEAAGGYGDEVTPPSEPPAKKPPVKTPHKPPAHHTPPSGPSMEPPAAHEPPSLPDTGAGSATMAASGVAALLMTSGVILYRRGRATARR